MSLNEESDDKRVQRPSSATGVPGEENHENAMANGSLENTTKWNGEDKRSMQRTSALTKTHSGQFLVTTRHGISLASMEFTYIGAPHAFHSGFSATRKDSSLLYLAKAGFCSIISFCLFVPSLLVAQEATSSTSASEQLPAGTGEISNAIHLMGLPDAKPNIKGDLKVTPNALDFTTAEIHALIPYNHITAVWVGNERTEAGGKGGAVARKLPWGIGLAFGLASQKKVDFLTIEFRDPNGGYHGAAFMLPTNKAEDLRARIAARITPLVEVNAPACSGGPPMAHSVLLAPIEAEGVDLPAEYRVLMYEHLYEVLKTARPSDSFFRAGNTSAGPGCTALTLHVTVLGFKKGNQTLRTATGPVGMFVGTTSMTFHIKLDDPRGETVLDTDVKKSKHGDSDSLNMAGDIAKNISKRIDKAMAKSQDSSGRS